MKNTIIIIVVLLIIGVSGYYFITNQNSNATPSNTPTVSNNPTNNISPDSNNTNTTVSNVTVDIKNFSFNPSPLTIKVGTKVTWINNDNVPHTVTSDSGSLLNSPTLSPGQSFSFTFTKSGTENYHCTIHPMMKSKIVVE